MHANVDPWYSCTLRYHIRFTLSPQVSQYNACYITHEVDLTLHEAPADAPSRACFLFFLCMLSTYSNVIISLAKHHHVWLQPPATVYLNIYEKIKILLCDHLGV